MATLLQHATTIFQANAASAHPQTFRAGGWTADLNTLACTADKGFIADTSALNWARIEEWQGHKHLRLEHGALGADRRHQPAVLCRADTDVLGAAGTPLNMLEVPDNGVMIDYVSAPEIERNLRRKLGWQGARRSPRRS